MVLKYLTFILIILTDNIILICHANFSISNDPLFNGLINNDVNYSNENIYLKSNKQQNTNKIKRNNADKIQHNQQELHFQTQTPYDSR